MWTTFSYESKFVQIHLPARAFPIHSAPLAHSSLQTPYFRLATGAVRHRRLAPVCLKVRIRHLRAPILRERAVIEEDGVAVVGAELLERRRKHVSELSQPPVFVPAELNLSEPNLLT